MQSLFNNAHLAASIHFDTISMKGSLAEYSFPPLFFSAAISFAKAAASGLKKKKKKKKKLLMVTLHFTFYVEDYSNSMSHPQGVSFTQSTEGQAFLPRLSLIFPSLCQWRGISGGRIAAVGTTRWTHCWQSVRLWSFWLEEVGPDVVASDHKPDPIVTAEGERIERTNLNMVANEQNGIYTTPSMLCKDPWCTAPNTGVRHSVL